MTAHFRLPPIRAPKVLAHANGQPCTLRFAGICNRNPETTVAAHIRDGHKGGAQKASDSSIAYACSDCHRFLDEGAPPLGYAGVPPAELDILKAMLRGLQETTEILIRDRVVNYPTIEEKQRSAKPRVKPRVAPELRQKVGGKSTWAAGRKMQSKPMNPKGPK